MNTVFVVFSPDYFAGVFSTREKAEAAIKEVVVDSEYYVIEGYKLDEPLDQMGEEEC